MALSGLTKTAVAAVQVTLVGVDDTVAAAHRLVLFGAKARTGTTLPGRSDTYFTHRHTFENKKKIEK